MIQYGHLQDTAYDYIKNGIVSGLFKAGEEYSLGALAQKLEMSRTPVRDALRRLSQENFVEILPSRGIRIRQLTEQDVIEHFQLRCAMEGYCCFQLAERADEFEDVIALLEENLAMEAAHSPDGGAETFLLLDRRFHRIIIDALNNSSFRYLDDLNNDRIRRFALNALREADAFERTVNEHCAVFEAIRSRDGAAAQAAMIRHLDSPLLSNLDEGSETRDKIFSRRNMQANATRLTENN